MKIGYDAKRLFTNFTGLGNYSRALISYYHRTFEEDELYLFTPSVRHDARTYPFINHPSFNVIQPSKGKLLWRTLDIVKDIHKSGVDIYHGLSHELPVGISKLDIGKVVTIHDLIFKYYPADNSWLDKHIYNWKWKHSCNAADKIIAISEQTRNDIIHYYNIQPEKITVIFQPADPLFSKHVAEDEMDTVKKKYGLPEIYNLYVGSVISRKNLRAIVMAMAQMNQADRIPLIIIGNGKKYKTEVMKMAVELKADHLLIWLGSPSFEDFPAIYKCARMMIYPSLHEGFGLPVLEAMMVGIPVITSNQSSLIEAGGKAAFLVDPDKPEEIAYAMKTIAGDDSLRSEMIQKGLSHAQKFNAEDATARLRQVYLDVLSR